MHRMGVSQEGRSMGSGQLIDRGAELSCVRKSNEQKYLARDSLSKVIFPSKTLLDKQMLRCILGMSLM